MRVQQVSTRCLLLHAQFVLQGQFSLIQGKARVVIARQVSTRRLLLHAQIVRQVQFSLL